MTQILKILCVSLSIYALIPALKSYAQPDPSSRKYIERLISEGGKSNLFDIYTLLACNEDSLFFENDTIRFYDDSDYFSTIGICCEFIEWELTGNELIRQQEPQTCMDPSSILVSSIRYYKYKIKKRKGRVFINLYTERKVFESFRLQNIEYIELPGENNCRVITFIRQSLDR